MNYAFGSWLEREFPTVEFERLADDGVAHCVTERQAREVWAALSRGFGSERLESVGLVRGWNGALMTAGSGVRPGVQKHDEEPWRVGDPPGAQSAAVWAGPTRRRRAATVTAGGR